jgi:hypothetical protein
VIGFNGAKSANVMPLALEAWVGRTHEAAASGLNDTAPEFQQVPGIYYEITCDSHSKYLFLMSFHHTYDKGAKSL